MALPVQRLHLIIVSIVVVTMIILIIVIIVVVITTMIIAVVYCCYYGYDDDMCIISISVSTAYAARPSVGGRAGGLVSGHGRRSGRE